MKKLHPSAVALLACALGTNLVLAAEGDPAPKPAATPPKPAAPAITLKMGDPAPEFQVGEWYKGGPVQIEADKSYIVECWATWCGPCIAAFPHLSELAKANEGKVTVIGVNVWERKTPAEVKTFVEGQGDKMSYHVVADGDKAIATNWLKAAGRNGIPCAFVVTKGKIGWIGHPAQLNQKLLDSILDGTFDVAAAAKAEEAKAAVGKYFSEHVVPKIQSRDFAGAISALEEMKKEFPGEEKTINMHIKRLQDQLSKTKPESK
ncbi:MAG: TlpA family protein disulfide reductase [Akkermansiaceae bacterium]|jgi:thiol-disulfide isomerase/thioredoxin|nr:TlpA family protein disulfide reductase [Akkermansiaceae bacterium]